MPRTVRELIRVLERASSQARLGDLTQVVIDGNADPHDRTPFLFEIPGEGDTAAGAHYDPDSDRVVIDVVKDPA